MRVEVSKLFEKINIEQTGKDVKNKALNNMESNGIDGASFGESLFEGVMNVTEVDNSMRGRDLATSYEEQIKNEAELIKNNLKALYNSMSCGKYAKMTGDGIDVNNMEIKDIVTVVDRIKIMLATYCKDANISADDINVEDIKKVLGSSVNVYKVAKKLEEADVPLTEDNFNETISAYEMYNSLETVSKETAAYLITNDLEPTIKNIYIAQNSAINGNPNINQKLDNSLWKELKSQIGKVIQDAGLEVNNNNFENAKWLLANDVPITTDTMKDFIDYQNIDVNIKKDAILDKIVSAISIGTLATEYNLVDGNKAYEEVQEAIKVLDESDVNDIIDLMQKDREITIKNLKGILDNNEDTNDNSEEQTNYYNANEEKCNKNYRLLLEARILMTSKAGLMLNKAGVEIDVLPLQELVDKLKEAELSYINLGVNNDDKITSSQMDIYTRTNATMYSVQRVPAQIIGKLLDNSIEYTIESVEENGQVMKAVMEKAATSYDALSTKVRKDLGDSLNQAVDNSASDMLGKLGYENNKENRRVLRILAYNNIDVERESFEKVRAIDSELNNLMENMTPENVLKLVKKGINPLTMEVDKLNEIVNNTVVNEDVAMKFSEFLYKLDKNHELDKKERDKYVGIYKAFNTIRKSDGKVIGSLLKQNETITLGNIMSAYKTMFNSVDTVIDDNTGLNENTDNGKYFKNLFKDITNNLDPDALEKALDTKDINELSVEELNEMLQEYTESEEYTKEAYKEYKQVFDRLKDSDNNVMMQLTSYKIPVTVNNLVSVYALNEDYSRYYKKIKSQFNYLEKDDNEALAKDLQNIFDSIDDKENLQSAYQKLDEDVTSYMNKYLDSQDMDVTTIDVRNLKLINNGISIINKWSDNENYVIPYELEDGDVGAINLKVVRDRDYGGRVTIDINNLQIGHIETYCICDDTRIKACITCDNNEVKESIMNAQENIEKNMQRLGFKECEISIGTSSAVPKINHAEHSTEKLATNKLYKVAKNMIQDMLQVIKTVNDN